jgi:hypothetical protein
LLSGSAFGDGLKFEVSLTLLQPKLKQMNPPAKDCFRTRRPRCNHLNLQLQIADLCRSELASPSQILETMAATDTSNRGRIAMMAVKLPSDFEVTTRKKLTETSSGKFFKHNNPKLVPSFDRGVAGEKGEVVGDGKRMLLFACVYSAVDISCINLLAIKSMQS